VICRRATAVISNQTFDEMEDSGVGTGAPLRLVRSTFRSGGHLAGPDQRTAPSRPPRSVVGPQPARPSAPLSSPPPRPDIPITPKFNLNFSGARPPYLCPCRSSDQPPRSTLTALCCCRAPSSAMAAATLLPGPAAASPRLGSAASAPSASHGRRRLTFSFRYARVQALTHAWPPARCSTCFLHCATTGTNALPAPACSWGVPAC
jgi:hypothetical protein